MSDLMTSPQYMDTSPKYEELIYEAFIDPIRNITVIDDEYPTLVQLILREINQEEIPTSQLSKQNLDRLKKLIKLCHEERKWGIDVFDSKAPELGEDEKIPSHLNNSDLIILDYHLDGEPTTDNGSQARKIIEKLEFNNHFNIILVHTKGFNVGEINQVFDEILCQFVGKVNEKIFTISDESEEKILNWLDDNDDEDRLIFEKKMGVQDVLTHMELPAEEVVAIKNPKHFFHGFCDDINRISASMEVETSELVKWLINDNIDRVKKSFEGKCQDVFEWSWNGEDGVNYIATGRVFISVILKKGEEPNEELIKPLKRSLVALNASPMHLLMARMRYEMDERGLEQANEIISNREAQAGWLYNLITRSEENPYEHDLVIDAHWEQLARSTKDELREFSTKLISAAKNKISHEGKKVVKHFFKECVNEKEVTLAHLNAFTCSQPVVSRHLTTGTVLKIDDKFWVCLSPACDLVPRDRPQWSQRIGNDHLAFKAVELHKQDHLKTANKNANNNNYIYLVLDNKPTAFSFTENKGNPIWDTFFASKKGLFDGGSTFISCIRHNENIVNQTADDGVTSARELEIVTLKAEAIAELRYEYALNLLQKLGSSQTRVGLGFTDSRSFIQ